MSLKKRILFIILPSLVLGCFLPASAQNEAQQIAVIELFTSQGCSSCPAADRLLSNTLKNTGTNNIFGLSFHVSYWNRLGWKDPYSSKEFTDRQTKYAAVMNLNTIYTPQMIVNGNYEFVGSNKAKLDYFTEKALNEDANVSISLSDLSLDANSIELNYTLEGSTQEGFLNLALVQKHVENYIPRGENRGSNLQHENVVRVFKTIYAEPSGRTNLDFDESIDLDDCLLIVYLQDKRTLRIYGASKLDLSKFN